MKLFPTLLLIVLAIGITECFETTHRKDLDSNQIHYPRGLLQTANSLDYLTGNYSDYGLDVDEDGLFNYLVINVGVNITEVRETYYLDITLRSVQVGILFGERISLRNKTVGMWTLAVSFDFSLMYSYRLNTSYRIEYLEFGYIENPNGTYFPINQIYDPYTTRIYNYLEFDPREDFPLNTPWSPTDESVPQGDYGLQFFISLIINDLLSDHIINSSILIAIILVALGISILRQRRT